jgi:fucose permease
MRMGHWVTVVVVLVIGYFIGKMYPNIFSGITSKIAG